ncbi:DNA cytosine methyltransferase [Bradyrhizobium tropiciagri]|nr:DNA cytosine methyltransferase [Bradyrhizobium tropiciagri]
MPSLESCELLQGFPSGWTAVEEQTVKKRPEWRLIGNAVSVPVARWVADRVKHPGTVGDFATKTLGDGASWPDAAWNIGDGRTTVHASDHPVLRPRPSISAFRDKHWTRLSDRALNGFIGRAVEGGLKMPVGFLEALQNASRKTVRAA